MKIKLFAILLSLFYLHLAKADIPKFDVLTLEVKGETYYYACYSESNYRIKDLCYFNFKGEYVGEITTHFEKWASNKDTIQIFKSLHQIDLTAFKQRPIDSPTDYLSIFKDTVTLNTQMLLSNYKLLDATIGNYYGILYTPALHQKDNIWMKKKPLEPLWLFSTYSTCELRLYSAKGQLSDKAFATYQKRILVAIEEEDYETFDEIILELYKKKVIMLGMCSC